jgi:hypothetical protein
MSQPEDPHELKSFEAMLAALVPRDDRLDRERLAFLAGQASVAANVDASRPRVGGWQHHSAWPAAFAAMSALAATLLIVLVARPAATGLSASGVGEIAAANGSRGSIQTRTMTLPEKLPNTLSARDALGGDIEQRLTKLSDEKSAPPFSVELPASPSLTPAAWRRVSDGTKFPVPSAGSSSPPVIWRANT